jgi:hypothetical protein
MSKQTAVEWLKKELEEYGSSSHLNLDWSRFDELIDQAKAMEKEHILEGYANGHEDGVSYMNNILQDFKNSEHYYNETYKGGEL